jgi:curved DNA-binding protein
VPRTASQADIKKAFRKLARQHHPDTKPGDTAAERTFKEVNEANEVLSDPAKRKQYDELGANWEAISRARQAGATGGGSPYGGFGGYPGGNVRYEFHTTADPGEFSDFFRMFFGEDVAGAGGGSPSTGGRGARPTGGLGFDDILSGMGIDGRATGPAGGARSRPVAPPTSEAQAEISLTEAYHGTTRLVEVEGRRLEITIPPGTQPARTFRLSGQGMPTFKGTGHGDLYVKARVILPTKLSDEAKAAARAFLDHVNQPDPRRPAATD